MNPFDFLRQIAALRKSKDPDDSIATVNRLIADVRRELKNWFAETPDERAALVAMARSRHASEEVQIDDDPGPLSYADNGVWVPAWVWIPNPRKRDR
jgi:hypothetical protein